MRRFFTSPILVGTLLLALSACKTAHVTPEGWKTYTHARYAYQVDYPADATIEESQGGTYSLNYGTPQQKEIPFPDGTCVTFHVEFAGVFVSSPDDPGNNNGDNPTYCGLVNMQTGGGNPETKMFVIDGKEIEATGYLNPAGTGIDSKDFLQTEWLTFTTPDNFRVVYRLDPANTDDLARYDQVKTTLEMIAGSLRKSR